MSRGGAMLASLLVTLGRPGWWLVALAGFLVRGGFVVFVLPIVLLPSPLAISNVMAPIIVPVALGRVGPEAIALFTGTVVLLSAWILVGGWIAAVTDLALIREAAAAAAEEGIGSPAPPPAPEGAVAAGTIGPDRVLIGKLVAARLLAWLPLAAAIGLGIVSVIGITYAQLTSPADVDSPLALRVAIAAAPELAIIAVTWLFGELVGGLALRWIVLGGASTGTALVAAAGEVFRKPGSTLLTWLATTGLLAWILAGTVAAAGFAWSGVLVALTDRLVSPATVALSLLLFVAIWLAALVLGGLFAAVRGSVQTVEYLQRRSTTRTFGASVHHRPGDWSIPGDGGSL